MMKLSFLAFVSSLLITPSTSQQCPLTWKCPKTETAPTLDGDLGEWQNIEGIESTLQMPLTNTTYQAGPASTKCMYDGTYLYLALEIPGLYRFNNLDNHLCAAIATMMKIGVDATYFNMGGCPEAITEQSTCDATVFETCATYQVDIGAHWELATTEQGVEYPVASTGQDGDLGDKYAVGAYCRNGDDTNEWSGAWKHSNSTADGATGTYTFELSRTLVTPSSTTDGQMVPGGTYEFGIAFWDPYETEVDGWTDPGHYVTGCTEDWIEMELVADGVVPTTDVVETTIPGAATTVPDVAETTISEAATTVPDVVETTIPGASTTAPTTEAATTTPTTPGNEPPAPMTPGAPTSPTRAPTPAAPTTTSDASPRQALLRVLFLAAAVVAVA